MEKKYDYLDEIIKDSFENVEVGPDFNEKLLNKIESNSFNVSLSKINNMITGLSLVLSGIFIVILNITSMEGYFFDVIIKARMFSKIFINYLN